jgi:hypothetical protein
MVPAVGLYANVPGRFDVASNCAGLKAVPAVIGAGVFHVKAAVALLTVNETDAVASL